MGRIGARFEALRARGERALVPFVTAGDPDLETTEALVLSMAEAGADLIELGVPFSDPIAEGPTIQRASERALRGGASLRRVLELVKRVRPKTDLPLLLMGYANPFLAMGERALATDLSDAGVDGIICPDLPPEEGEALYAALEERGVDPVLLAAPTTTDTRLRMLAQRSRGFLYYVSLTGVTGARRSLSEGIEQAVARIRSFSAIPVCVGFGVSTPEHAREIARYADGVVVGSALVDRIEQSPTRDAAVDAVARLITDLKSPLRTQRVQRGRW